MLDEKIFIYSMGRCGSLNFQRALQHGVDYHGLMWTRPFSPNLSGPEIIFSDEPLNELEDKFDFIKDHFINSLGMRHHWNDFLNSYFMEKEYEIETEKRNKLFKKLDCKLFEKFGRVILMFRKNYVKNYVSSKVIDETHIEHKKEGNETEKLKHKLPNTFKLNPDDFKHFMKLKKFFIEDRGDFLVKNNIPYEIIIYEDFFEDKKLNEKIRFLENLIENFLDMNFVNRNLDKIKSAFTYKENKLIDDEIYKRVTNIDELSSIQHEVMSSIPEKDISYKKSYN